MNTIEIIAYFIFKHRYRFLDLVLVVFCVNDNVMQKGFCIEDIFGNSSYTDFVTFNVDDSGAVSFYID